MVDEKDHEIIDVLRDDGRASVRDISADTGIPASTVHSRLQDLRADGVVQGFTVEVDPAALGLSFRAYVLITVGLDELRDESMTQGDLVGELELCPGVMEASIITGSFDILLSVRTEDKASFNKLLQEDVQLLTGVNNTKTILVLR